MFRINHHSDFALRLVFSDADRLPVKMNGVDFDFWFSTKPGAAVFFAASRAGICNACEILDDGSVLVRFDSHRLQPGQLQADFAIHSDDESMPDGKNDIRLRPVIPVELTDSPFPNPSCDRHGPKRPPHHHGPFPPDDPPGLSASNPIIVNITIPLHRPDLSHHVTRDELETALKSFALSIDVNPADKADIDPILKMFEHTQN